MKTNKKELTVFALCAYAIPFLMMPLLYICLQNGRDTSIFANAQMFYPAVGVMLAFLLAMMPVRAGMDDGAQAVFFSMLFPQLAPGGGEATPGEAVAL